MDILAKFCQYVGAFVVGSILGAVVVFMYFWIN